MSRVFQRSLSWVLWMSLLIGFFAARIPHVHAATLTVTSVADDGSAGTLRSIIQNAAPGDTIIFAVTGTITLTSEITLDKNLNIQGPGASSLTLSGNNANRIFFIPSGVNIALSGLTLANGNSTSNGGGILNIGTLTVTASIFADNTAGFGGGGILNGGTLTITTSTFRGNSAGIAGGGGLFNNLGTVSISHSTFVANTTIDSGGGIYNGGNLTVINSTLSGNSAAFGGGGIMNDGNLTINNSTLTGNSAGGSGGGVINLNFFTVRNSIIANNIGFDCLNFTIGGTFNSLVETGCPAAITADPQLGPLADNGGPTLTHALSPGSPAIDAGNDATCATADQRGAARVDTITGGSVCDIGAFEANGLPPTISFTVNPASIVEATASTTTVTVTATNLTTPVSVYFTFGGAALYGTDYTTTGLNPDNSLSFTAGDSVQTFTLTAISDLLTENSELMTLLMHVIGVSGITGANPQSVTITDPIPPTAIPPTAAPTIAAENVSPAIGIFDPAISKIGFLVPGQVGVTGEQLEWIVTVTNNGTATGTNIQITDIVDSRLSVNSIDTPVGQAVVAGQTVVVTLPTLAPGQTVQFSIFTTVLRGVSVSNSACLIADNTAERCSTGFAIQQLPATGETPFWRTPLLIALLLLLVGMHVLKKGTLRSRKVPS